MALNAEKKMDQAAAELLSVAERFDQFFRQRRQARAAAIHETAGRIQRHLGAWAAQLQQQLREQLHAWDRTGIPPSFVTVAGQSHLEKPLNRLLAWWVNPDAEHGLGMEFLKCLAQLSDLPDMAEDLSRGERPEIVAEQSPDDDESAMEPDLMVRTSGAALLLENKLWSPESGNQYQPYRELLGRWGKSRARRAVLCAPDRRDLPEGWDRVILHDDLARILDDLSHRPDAPVWGRIAAAVCARSFSAVDVGERIRHARGLLDETAHEPITPSRINRLRAALPLPTPLTPWEDAKNG